MLGDGTSSVGLTGLADRSRAVLQSKAGVSGDRTGDRLEDPADEQRFGRFLLAGIPADLAVLLQDAYTRAHASIPTPGVAATPEPTMPSASNSTLCLEQKDMCFLVAAGNDGTDKDGDGTINPMSVTSPARPRIASRSARARTCGRSSTPKSTASGGRMTIPPPVQERRDGE